MGKSLVDLGFDPDGINVRCILHLSECSSEFRFSLNDNLTIDGITDGNNDLEWSVDREWSPVFRAKCKEITVKASQTISSVHITYHGGVNGWCNLVQDDKRVLNYYSCWYPQECSVNVGIDTVNIRNCEDYTIINADRDMNGIWVYGGNGYDTANIIALRNGDHKSISKGRLTFYHILPEEESAANIISHHYEAIIEYYGNRLYSPRSLKRLVIVSLGLPESSGAYFRKELIVLSRVFSNGCTLDNISESMGALLAHEIAHEWCTDADCTTWEDWLNETTAEWSALLYALYIMDDRMFHNIIDGHLARFDNLLDEKIRTDDGSRPNGAHTKGTVLFYRIYQKYGVETIERLLRTFVDLPVKDTESYLRELENAGLAEVADIIARALVMHSYEGLLLG